MTAVGARWSVLVLRDLMYGRHRFAEIAASTGAPRDVLTARLRELESDGLVHRVQYSQRPPRFEYHLTAAGADLAPILAMLASWGDKWRARPGLPAPVVFRHAGHEASARLACGTCGELVDLADVTAESTTGAWEGELALGAAATPPRG
jgi:DNA-binding HxlR family transcriptional regulator